MSVMFVSAGYAYTLTANDQLIVQQLWNNIKQQMQKNPKITKDASLKALGTMMNLYADNARMQSILSQVMINLGNVPKESDEQVLEDNQQYWGNYEEQSQDGQYYDKW